MKHLLYIFIFLFSCSHKSKSQDNDLLKQAQEKGKFYASQIDESVFVRCDKLAFLPYLSVAGYEQRLDDFEDNGRWNRDRKQNPNCYPNDSKGTISFEGLLAMLHHAWIVKDREMVHRFIKYSEDHNWIVGEGDFSNQIAIAPISYKVMDKLDKKDLNVLFEKEYVGINDVLKGYRGHIVASYIWLNGRISGKINSIEKKALRELLEASPNDPFYIALNSRYDDGDQNRALGMLLNRSIFPDTFPEATGAFGWGSAPMSVYYLMVLSVIEGF